MRQGLLRATLVPGGGSGTPENEVKAERGRAQEWRRAES